MIIKLYKLIHLHSNLVIFKFLQSSWDGRKYILIYIPIWWYSNSWKIDDCNVGGTNLHSNLVIFKLYCMQDLKYCQVNLHSNLVIFKFGTAESILRLVIVFTFQSGDIQIRTSISLNYFFSCIYIPIWWYSNMIYGKFCSFLKLIYIPIWWYSNGYANRSVSKSKRIYIPIWWYSNQIFKNARLKM